MTEIREHRADTPAELRALIEDARADPRVEAFPYESRRELHGTEPTTCGRGHTYGSGRYELRRDWLVCRCGGHMVYVCLLHQDGVACGNEQIDPVVAYDCDVAWPRSAPRPG